MDETKSGAGEGQKPGSQKSTASFTESAPESFTQVFAALSKSPGQQVPSKEKDADFRPCEVGSDFISEEAIPNTGADDQRYRKDSKVTLPFEKSALEQKNASPDAPFHYRANDRPHPEPLNRNREGEFTQLLRRVSGASNNGYPSVRSTAPRADIRPGTPGEFTRIVSGSILRESERQSSDKNQNAKDESSAAWQRKGQTPLAGTIPAYSPAVARPNIEEHAAPKQLEERATRPLLNSHDLLSGPREVSQMAENADSLHSRVADRVTSAISTRVPSGSSSTVFTNSTSSRLQEYVPLLLIANLFLTVLLLLLVGLAFLRH